MRASTKATSRGLPHSGCPERTPTLHTTLLFQWRYTPAQPACNQPINQNSNCSHLCKVAQTHNSHTVMLHTPPDAWGILEGEDSASHCACCPCQLQHSLCTLPPPCPTTPLVTHTQVMCQAHTQTNRMHALCQHTYILAHGLPAAARTYCAKQHVLHRTTSRGARAMGNGDTAQVLPSPNAGRQDNM